MERDGVVSAHALVESEIIPEGELAILVIQLIIVIEYDSFS